MGLNRMGSTLDEIAAHLSAVYGRRNALVLHSLAQRIQFLILGVKDMQDAIRKEAQESEIATTLARVVARIFCIKDHFVKLPLSRAMKMKYGRVFCSYCKEFPCACTERRAEVSLVDPSEQLAQPQPFTLTMWQQYLNAMYGERNRLRGSAELISRLGSESAEVLIIAMRSGNGLSIDTLELDYALELADTLAWTIAVANFWNIDVEAAILSRYGDGCHRCKKLACSCPAFDPHFMDWAKLQ